MSALQDFVNWLHKTTNDMATASDTCYGMTESELVPFWIAVTVLCGVYYYVRHGQEGKKEKGKKGREGLASKLRKLLKGRSGRDALLDDASGKLESARAPPTCLCQASKMQELCGELGIQRGLEAASLAVLVALQQRRRYGSAALGTSDGATTKPLQLAVDLEQPTLAFVELLKAVDQALREPAADGAQGEEPEIVFQWGAEASEAGHWCARPDATGKGLAVLGSSSEEAQSFQILFEAVSQDASANVWQVPLLSKSAAEAVEAWGSPALRLDAVKDASSGRLVPMPRLLASRQHAASDSLAVAGDGFGISHRELHKRTAAVAEAVLKAKAASAAAPTLGGSSAVVVYMGRGEAIAPAFLGVMQAGCHVVPADLHWPLERVAHVAQASGALLALVEPASAERWQAVGAQLPCVTVGEALFAEAGAVGAGAAAPGELEQDDPAVILFTSGSTGLPKGIVLSHGYLTALVHGVAESKGMVADTRALCYHSPTWMPFLDYLFGPLLKGGCCLYFPEGKSHVVTPKDLRAFGVRHGATNVGFVPAMLDVLLEEGLPPKVSGLGVGGAAVPAELCTRTLAALQALGPSGVLYTGYSGTEQGDVTQLQMRGEDDVEAGTADGGFMGAGRPHGAQRCKVLDQGFQLVGAEGVGEICVSGPGLASGYLQLPEKTAETFVPAAPAFRGERMARSGDLGKWTASGHLKVVGRRDSMVKVRGARIELGEVEAAVASHAAVKQVVVTVWEDQLVAYVVPAIPADLRDHCKARLVPYMVPHLFEGIEELPRLPNGKINKRALPAPTLRTDGAETVMELDSLGQMRKFTRKAASEDRVLDNVRAILIAVVIQSHALNVVGDSLEMKNYLDQGLGAKWGPVQFLLLKLVYSGGWSSLAFLSGFDDTRAMRPYGLTYREVLFMALWPMLGFMWTLWYLPVFVYMRSAFCAAHHMGVERLHLLIAAQAWILMPAFVDMYIGWTPNGPTEPCPSQCFCPFEAFPDAQPLSVLLFGWWVSPNGAGSTNFTRHSFLGHGMIFIPCYWLGFYTGGYVFKLLTRLADEPSLLKRAAVAAGIFAVYFLMYKTPVTDSFNDRCAAFWSPEGSFVYQQVLKNLLYFAQNLSMSLLYVFFIAACVPVHLKHLSKVSFSALILSGFVPCINDYAVMALNLRHYLPEAISPGMELAWIFSVPVVFVLVSGSLITLALPVLVKGVRAAVRALSRSA